MFDDIKGKKLLILGCTQDDCQIVEAAKSLGVHTVATDNHLDWNEAPAKIIADEAWDVSWSDIPALEKRCISEGIDGVMAGFSEFRIDNAIKLSKAINTPFYAEDEVVLQRTFDKRAFKDYCRKNNVPVVPEYDIDETAPDYGIPITAYPVLVKPVDNAGSRGIIACADPDKLDDSLKYALSFSGSGDVIVEKLVTGAREVVVYYTIADGKVALSAMCDKFERNAGTGFNALPDAYLYPSRWLDDYIERHNDDVVKTIEDMGISNGSVNLQGFALGDGSFLFFEMDYRPGGTSTFHFTEHFNNVNYLKMLISYSLVGNMHPELLSREDPRFGGKVACSFTLLSKSGVIRLQEGKEEVDSLTNVIHSCYYHPLGTEIEVNGSQFPKTFRAYIVGETVEDVQKTICVIQDTVRIEDEDGKSLLFEPFDPGALAGSE